MQVQLSTPGGRKLRTQVRAESVRLCDACADLLAKGTVPDKLEANIDTALRKLRGAA